VLDRPASILRSSQRIQLNQRIAFARKAGAGHVHFWPDESSTINCLLEIEVGVGLERASCSNGSDATRQIKPRKTKRHNASQQISRIEKVVYVKEVPMHVNESGKGGVP